MLRCPDCGAQLRGKASGEGNFLTLKDLERSRKRCTAEVPTRGLDKPKATPSPGPAGRPCGSTSASRAVWAPADYIHKHMRGVFDYLICDEVHEEKSETSARANALGALVASCRKVVAMTGTLIGGKAGHVRSLLFRLSPKSLKAEGLAWEDDMEFARRYGRVDTIITEKTSAGDDNRRSNGKSTTKRQAEQPGIMPTLYGRHLIGNTIFLSLKDVAADLPQYDEHPTPVRMSADLAGPYREMEGKLKDAVAELLRRGNHQLLSGMLHALLAYPDYPYDWKPIGYVDGKGGPHGRFVLVTTPPTLDKATRSGPRNGSCWRSWPQEKAQGRQSLGLLRLHQHATRCCSGWRRSSRTPGTRSRCWRPTRFPPGTAARGSPSNAPGVDVIISHPQPVRTGLTLFDAMGAHNFPSLDLLRDRLRPVHPAAGVPPLVADRPEASLPRLLPVLQGDDAGPGHGR